MRSPLDPVDYVKKAARSAARAAASSLGYRLFGEFGLEALDHLDGRGVDVAQDGQVQRYEVSQKDEREQSLDRIVPAALEAQHTGRAGLDQARGELDSLPDAWVLVDVLEEHGRKRADLGSALPSHDLVVVRLGQLGEEGGNLSVLVD